jgi:ATP-binding cassette, subfamily C, bacterial LapB
MADEKPLRDWLKEFLRPMRKTFIEMLVMSVFVNLIALVVPVFTMQVYDRVIFSNGISTLWGLVIGVGLVVVFDFIIKQSRSRIMQTVALRVDVEVGRKLFDKVTSLPLDMLESRSSGFWQALFRDVDMIRNTLSGAPAILIADLPFTFVFLAIIWVIAAPLVPVLAVIWCLYIFIAWRSSAIMNSASQDERESTQSRDQIISEMINGRTTIKALGLERTMRPMWELAHAENIENSSTRGSKTDSFSNFGGILSIATTVSMTTVGAIFIIAGDLTMGSLIAANMLSGRLLGPLNQLVGTWRVYSSFGKAVERLGEVFAAESDRIETEIEIDRPRGEISMEDVCFSYSEEAANVVDGIKIGIRSGGLHAVVGRNGCGKTTMIKLMQGLYKPKSGRVMLDGADIAQFSREQLVNWIGYVPQETVLFAGSVRDNIAYGNPNADDDQIIKAATAAGVHKFIIDLPDGYGSEIGEAGQRLSGGQRQRIAIARALVSDPVVLLLDEPSSNLDRQAEEEIRDTLKGLSDEHTIILVSHSPVLLQGCDNLIALDRGKIALAGPAKDILPRLFGTGKKQAAPEKPSEKPTGKTAEKPGEKPSGIPKPGDKPSGIQKPGDKPSGIPKPTARPAGIPKPTKRATPAKAATPAKPALPAAASKRPVAAKPAIPAKPAAAKPSEPSKAEKLFKAKAPTEENAATEKPVSSDIEVEPETTITTISGSKD